MSKIAVITKNFPRHFDFIVSLMETGHLSCAAMVIDEDNVCSDIDKLNQYYINSEHKFFGNKFNNISRIKTVTFNKNNINSDKLVDFINSTGIDLTIIYDVDNINDNTLSLIKNDIWKLTFGYTQYFKGYYCNIHAALNNKSQSICSSLIEFKDNSYTGRIIHQTPANYRQEDTITDAEYRSLRKMMFDMEKIIEIYNNNAIKYYDNSDGKYFNSDDLNENDIDKLIQEKEFLVKNTCDNESINFIKQI